MAPADPKVAPPFLAARFEIPPGVTNERDCHEVVEIWMIRQGVGTVHCDEHLLDVAPGDMILFPSHVPHQITNTGPDPLRLFTVWWNRETS